MSLPTRLFFTGVPGSKWSGIAQVLERLQGTNNSDKTNDRTYTHHSYSGHTGAYFGTGMEFPPVLDTAVIDSAHKEPGGMKIIKSHEWAHGLSRIAITFPEDWIMLVYRPDHVSYAWWHEAGGFNIKYPDYSAYKNSVTMLSEIQQQNQEMLEWSIAMNLKWSSFTPGWVEEQFGEALQFDERWTDVLVTIYKGR